MKKSWLIATIIALIALAVPASAHYIGADAEVTGCRQVTVTVNSWDGFYDDIDGYAGDLPRTATVAILVDGVEYDTVQLEAPTFSATSVLIVPAGVREITAIPTSWGDGQEPDPLSAQTITVQATCVVGTTTTTVPVTVTVPPTTTEATTTTVPDGPPPCATNDPGDPTPCPFDTTTTVPEDPQIPHMPDPDPVPGTPIFTG